MYTNRNKKLSCLGDSNSGSRTAYLRIDPNATSKILEYRSRVISSLNSIF